MYMIVCRGGEEMCMLCVCVYICFGYVGLWIVLVYFVCACVCICLCGRVVLACERFRFVSLNTADGVGICVL